MANPTHRHKPTGSLVYPQGYAVADLEVLATGAWETHEREAALAGVRQRRDALLAASDPMMLPDRGLSEAALQRWVAYRQALRDLPALENPQAEWPVPPGAKP